MANENLEFMFVRDVIRYVLVEYWSAINWTPNGIFVHQNQDSLFNTSVKGMMEKILDKNVRKIGNTYINRFLGRNISGQQHLEFCKELIETLGEPKPEEVTIFFLDVCANLSLITGFSVLYDVIEAPHITHILIFGYFTKLTDLGVITNSFWKELLSNCAERLK
ncbi:hypothetical protein NPIL_274221 [Nephila pilipes]|uniref:Uncharacterized protein n=1 Tax=Nephila pilipes TaxID=299642 RepID=A0A8X6R2L8_NEPPI|nr:hypothetical protein NPIL_274221 [Nephila pilipes]